MTMSIDYPNKLAKRKPSIWDRWDGFMLFMHWFIVILWLIASHSREAVILSAILYWRASR